MPKLSFKVFFDSRGDSTPTHDGWTYHHVLPWRYYYLMGYIIANVSKLKYLKHDYKINDVGLANIIEQEQVNDDKALEEQYGSEVLAFNRNLNESGPKLIRLLQTLHGTANQNSDSIVDKIKSSQKFDLGGIGNLCSAPKFGGFLGMAPEIRCDDLGDRAERLKPEGARATWWGNLMLLKTYLESFCNTVADASAGSTISATVHYKDFVGFLATVRSLSSSFVAPYDFDVEDWCIYSVGKNENWAYITGVPKGMQSVKKVGKIFKIREASIIQSGLQVSHRDESNCRLGKKVFSKDNNNKKDFSWFQ